MSGHLPATVYGVVGFNQAALPTGSGLALGQTQIIWDSANNGFREVMLVKAGATIAANKGCKWSATGTVIPTAAAGDLMVGVNDLTGTAMGTGASVANGNFFYMTIRGYCNPLVAAGVAQFAALTTSATSGQLAAWTDLGATFSQTNLQTLAASGGGGATLCYMT